MSPQYPKISIIIPSLNQADFLEETLTSVLSQNYPKLELIIIDGGSTDHTISIIKKYQSKITCWISEPDSGQSDAINKGILRSTGEIIAWLNSDDQYEKDTLALVAENFQDSPSLDFLFGDCEFFGNNYREINQINIVDFKAKQLGLFPYSQPSCFFRRKLIDDNGFLDTNFHYCLDVDLFVRFAMNARMRYLPKVLSKFRLHENSKTNKYPERFLQEWVIIYSKILRTLKSDQLIEIAKELGIYREGSDRYEHYSGCFSMQDQYNSFIYFLERQLYLVFPTGTRVVNLRKLKLIEHCLSRANNDAVKASFPIRSSQYFLNFNRQLLNPVNLFKNQLKKINFFKALYSRFIIYYIKNSRLVRRQIKSPKEIPIIIINYNQLSTLKLLVSWLKDNGYRNLHVIDNNSNYRPLLDFYQKSPEINVVRLKRNVGHMALWKNFGLIKKYNWGYYAVTDPDIIPISDCPSDFMEKFLKTLQLYPEVTKAGFSLKIDDLPDHYPLKSSVLDWESKFWTTKANENSYLAEIDTTFALYRPKENVFKNFYSAIRLGFPYTARHLSWYQNPQQLTDEEKHYLLTANKSNTWMIQIPEKEFVDFDVKS